MIDITNQRFGKLVAIGPASNTGRWTVWNVVCDCGTRKTVPTHALRSGNTKSCGCLVHQPNNYNLQHGMSYTYMYRAWTRMKVRCGNKGNLLYGGRGITVCERWINSFENFFADMGVAPAGTSLDRINNNGNYEPGNCRWATPSQQLRNRRVSKFVTWQGQRYNLADWAELVGVSYMAANNRVRLGWPLEKIIATPVKSFRRKSTLQKLHALNGSNQINCMETNKSN